MKDEQLQHVLELVLFRVKSKITYFRCSLVNKHMQSVVHADVKQRFPQLLKQHLHHHNTDDRHLARISAYEAPTKWLCSVAGRKAVGSVEAATVVLSVPGTGGLDEEMLNVLIEAGLRLSDAAVLKAAAHNAEGAQEMVQDILRHTCDNRAEQHAGLSTALRAILTAKFRTRDEDVLEQVKAANTEDCAAVTSDLSWCAGVLTIMCSSSSGGARLRLTFRFLLEEFLKQQQQQQQQQQHKHPSASSTVPRLGSTVAAAAGVGRGAKIGSANNNPLLGADGADAAAQQHAGSKLVQLLRMSLASRPGFVDYPFQLIAALSKLPAALQPGLKQCVELLVLAVKKGCDECIPTLQHLPAMKFFPLPVFLGILRSRVHAHSSLSALLKFPQAQGITTEQVYQLLRYLAGTSYPPAESAELLLSLPAAEGLTSDQALQLLKAALNKDGKEEAKPSTYSDYDDWDNEEPPGRSFNAFKALCSRLTEQGALELLQLAAHYQWEQMLDVLLECELFTNQINAEGWPQAFHILASTKAFTRYYGVGSKLLSIQAVQQLRPEEAYAVMLTLAERGREFTSAFEMITAARDISCEQVTTLLQLTMQHGNFTDVANLSRCEAAEELDADFVLQISKRVLAGWCGGRTMYGQSEALSGLLTLIVANTFTDEQCNELAGIALEQGNPEALCVICESLTLRETSDWHPTVTQDQLLCLFREAIHSCNQEALKLLLSLAEQHQVSTDQLQELLLQAMAMASGVAKEAGKVREGSGQPVGARITKQDWEVQQRKAQLVVSLLGVKSAERLNPDQVTELLDASTAQELLDVTRALMKLPAGNQLKADHLEQLLVSCAELHVGQLYGGSILQGQVFKLLLEQPAVKDFDVGSVPRLLEAFVRSGFGKPEPAADSRTSYRSSLQGRSSSSVGSTVDPVKLLIDLPVLKLFDGSSVAELLETCVESGVRQSVLESVLALPGAAQMIKKQLRHLVELCAQHRRRAAMQLLLQHSAAPDGGDSELQLLLLAC